MSVFLGNMSTFLGKTNDFEREIRSCKVAFSGLRLQSLQTHGGKMAVFFGTVCLHLTVGLKAG